MMEQKYTFFNAALRDGHVMSTPIYEPLLEFIPSLVYEIQSIDPEFCWIQFVFREYNQMMDHLLQVKGDLHDFMVYAETKDTNDRGEKVDRRELYTEWYRTAKKRIDKIDKMRSSTLSLLGIQGMWASSSSKDLSKLSPFFSGCRDEIDTLRLSECKDVWMLRELVNRRIVIDELPGYFTNYGNAAREEVPTLVMTQKEIPYYIHLPTEKVDAAKLSESIASGAADSKPADDRKDEGTGLTFSVTSTATATAGSTTVCQIERLPVLEKLDESGTARLGHIPVASFCRSMEIVYRNKKFEFLLSSEDKQDLFTFQRQLSSIYGEVNFVSAHPIPEYVRTTLVADFRNEVSGNNK